MNSFPFPVAVTEFYPKMTQIFMLPVSTKALFRQQHMAGRIEERNPTNGLFLYYQ
jgi:hypothetical protein